MKYHEKTILSETMYEGKIITVKKDLVSLSANNQHVPRELVVHSGGVCVAARLNNGNYLLVSQYRYGVQETSLEFVAGKLEVGEDPHQAIRRELEEETGYRANSWTYLGVIYPSPAYLSEKIHLFFAEDLTKTQTNLDENEFLEVAEYSLDQLKKMVKSNTIKDAKTIVLISRL